MSAMPSIRTLLCALVATWVAAGAVAAEPLLPTPACDRACLYRVLDDYRDVHRRCLG